MGEFNVKVRLFKDSKQVGRPFRQTTVTASSQSEAMRKANTAIKPFNKNRGPFRVKVFKVTKK